MIPVISTKESAMAIRGRYIQAVLPLNLFRRITSTVSILPPMPTRNIMGDKYTQTILVTVLPMSGAFVARVCPMVEAPVLSTGGKRVAWSPNVPVKTELLVRVALVPPDMFSVSVRLVTALPSAGWEE